MHLLVIVLVASCSLTLYTLLHDLSITPSSPSLVPQRHPTPHRSLAITDLSRIVEQQVINSPLLLSTTHNTDSPLRHW